MSQYSTINSEISRITENISDAYVAAADLGAVLPINQNSDNLPSCLNTITKPPLIPSNSAGLCLWLDGDCNTRAGLDRSKKYFENLMWTRPITDNTKGNLENTSNTTNSAWVNTNLLHLANGCAQYPQPYCTASNEYTVEAVIKVVNAFPASSQQTVVSFGSQNVGGFSVYITSDKRCNAPIKGTDGTNYTIVGGTLNSVNDIIYLYFRVKSNATDGGISGNISTGKVNVHPTGHTAAFNLGFGCSSSTGTSPTANAGNIAVGMLRFWSRALTDNEIQANYLDAKNRFGCI